MELEWKSMEINGNVRKSNGKSKANHWKLMEIEWKSMEINGNLRKSNGKSKEDHWKLMEIEWKSMEINGSTGLWPAANRFWASPHLDYIKVGGGWSGGF